MSTEERAGSATCSANAPSHPPGFNVVDRLLSAKITPRHHQPNTPGISMVILSAAEGLFCCQAGASGLRERNDGLAAAAAGPASRNDGQRCFQGTLASTGIWSPHVDLLRSPELETQPVCCRARHLKTSVADRACLGFTRRLLRGR
jgi:hypothetical protein